MEALLTITGRASARQLGGAIPPDIHIEAMLVCAMNAPDHGRLRPWRFIVIKGQGRDALGDLFSSADCNTFPEAAELARKRAMLSPLVLVCVECARTSPKVSAFEQTLSVGAAIENIILAAAALGYGTMWKTGPLACDPVVVRGLGLSDGERIAAFLHVGEIEREGSPRSRKPLHESVTFWPSTDADAFVTAPRR